MATTHISVAEAARDFAALIERVQAGEEIVIEQGPAALAVLKAAIPRGRRISDVIAALDRHGQMNAHDLVMGASFAEDVDEHISTRAPWNPPTWD